MKTFNLNRFAEMKSEQPQNFNLLEVSAEEAEFKYGSFFEQQVGDGDYVVIIPQQLFKRTMTIRDREIKADSVVALIYDDRWQLRECILFGVSQLTKKSMGTFVDRNKEYGVQALRTIPKTSAKGYTIPAEKADTRMVINGALNFVTKDIGAKRKHVYIAEMQVFHKLRSERHCFPIFNPDYTSGSFDLWKMDGDLICLEPKTCSIYEKVTFRGKLPSEKIACLPCDPSLLVKSEE